MKEMQITEQQHSEISTRAYNACVLHDDSIRDHELGYMVDGEYVIVDAYYRYTSNGCVEPWLEDSDEIFRIERMYIARENGDEIDLVKSEKPINHQSA